MSNHSRRLIIGGAGIAVILLAFGALLLPLAAHLSPRIVIGWMLLGAGILELVAASLRWAHRPSAVIAGGATLLAGLRLLFDPGAGFFEVLNLFILLQVVRAAALAFAAFRARDTIGAWLAFAAGTDFLLAIALLAGLPIAILVVGLFGPTRPISATFAWVIALSFIATGALLLATAKHEGRESRPPDLKPAG